MKNRYRIITFIFSIATVFVFLFCSCSNNNQDKKETIQAFTHPEGYQLVQSTILGRHSVRSPLSDPDSILGKLTPNKWHNWSSSYGNLSIRGGNQTMMVAQYLRQKYERENLFQENYQPKDDETYFYANSQQRTIATSNIFATGILPVVDHTIIHTLDIGNDDPVFWRPITKYSQEYINQVYSEINQICGENGIDGLLKKLEPNLKTLEKVLDFRDSQYSQEHNITSFPLDDTKVNFKGGQCPQMEGTLKLAILHQMPLNYNIMKEEEILGII